MPTFTGDENNNVINGGSGDDVIFGLGGSDTLDGGAGNDTMNGGHGDDYYFVDSASDRILESTLAGFDTAFTTVSFGLAAESEIEALRVLFASATTAINLTGNEFGQVLSGNAGANILSGLGGDDYLEGRGGGDTLDGGAGNDVLIGGTGDDYYFVDSAADRVLESAGEGRDTVFTAISFAIEVGSEIEELRVTDAGAATSLNLTGNERNQVLAGNAGANVLNGRAGDDYLEGRAGNDTLDGGTGADVMIGGAGNDYYFVDSAGDRVLEGLGEGRDVVFTTVSFALEAGSEVEELRLLDAASGAAINLSGNERDQVLAGNSGANVLNGFGGDDYLEGRSGNDTLDGGTGNDALLGGAGDDYYFVDSIADRVLENVGEGRDVVFTTGSFAIEAGSEVEELRLLDGSGTASLNLSGNERNQILAGNAGANILSGGAGDDYLEGRAGNDTLDGGAGADVLIGGIGNDGYRVDSASDRVIEAAGGGTDSIYSSANFALEAGSEVEFLYAADPAAVTAINLTGNDFSQNLIGNAGANILGGGGGNDLLRGDAGNDSLIGGAGTDNLYGGVGTDSLTGGAGVDWFHFNTALGVGNVDTITDFNLAEDRIVLDGSVGGVFQPLATGGVQAGWFGNGDQATSSSHRILYNSGTGALRYDADGVGGQAAVQFASLTPGTNLDWTAFVVDGPANNLPAITSGSAASVIENTSASAIVYQIAASDPDGDSLLFGIAGADASLFNVDGAGAVRLNAPANFEVRQSYNFSVWAYDSSGTGVSKAVTLSVTDVAETVAPYAISEGNAANDSVSQAVPLNRSLFTITPNSNVPDDDLPSAQISGSISTVSDRDFFSISLTAGELLVLDVDGTVTLDAFLRVFGPGGSELTSNDDAVTFDPGSNPHTGVSHNMDSLVKFRAPTDGTYYFAIESFSDETGPTSSGSYTLNVSIGPQATAAQLIEENIEALSSGSYWTNLNVTFGFPSFAGQYGSGEATDERATFEALLPAQQTAARQMLSYAATLTNLSFTEATSSPGGAMMRFGRTQDGETAHAYYPGSGDGGDSWYNSVSGDYDNPLRGNYAWTTFLHEIGHALGLKHGHESPALTPDRNSLEYSVMTYSPYIGASTGPDGGYTNETFGFPQTYMMFDIAALQRAYGADFTTNNGDSVYSWSSSTGAFMINSVTQWTPGANRVFQTIWDGGGTDTYDLSNYSSGSGTTIDLRPGQFSLFSTVQRAYLGEGHYAAGNVANALLYNGDTRSLIENVIGTQGSDTIIGNDVANRLTGGAGADVFSFLSLSQSTASAPDSIADFQSADRLNLAGVDANSGSSGDDAFNFIGSAAFGGQAGQLRSQTVGSDLHILGDTNGDAVADLQIILLGVSNLSTSQFSAL